MKFFYIVVEIFEKQLWRNSFYRPTASNFTKKWALHQEFFKDFNCCCRTPILKKSSWWFFPILGTPTFKSHVRFKNSKSAKRKGGTISFSIEAKFPLYHGRVTILWRSITQKQTKLAAGSVANIDQHKILFPMVHNTIDFVRETNLFFALWSREPLFEGQ